MTRPREPRRRPYGTGTLETRRNRFGRDVFYARFYVGGRQVKRRLGSKRAPGDADGLTQAQAERALQRLVDEQMRLVPVAERVDVAQAGERYLIHLEQVMKRKATTLQDYSIMLRKHLAPFFGGRSLERIDTQMVSDYLVAKQREGLASKTVANQLTFLAEPLGLEPPRPATPAQLNYLLALRGERSERPALLGLTRGVASAWIRTLLAQQTVGELEGLELRRGDLILYRRKPYDLDGDPDGPDLREETHVVSSISDSGRVNFKKTHHSYRGLRGPAHSAWPSNVTVIARAERVRGESPSAELVGSPSLDDVTPRRRSPSAQRAPKTIPVLKLWGRALVKLRYDASLKILWAPLTRRDRPGSPTEDEDALEVVAALTRSTPDTAVVALLRQGLGSVAVTLHCTATGPDIRELLPSAAPAPTGDTVAIGIAGDLHTVERALIERARQVQRRRLER